MTAENRTIPARAGKPEAVLVDMIRARDHPRAGGETRLNDAMVKDPGGPSPRGRGNHAMTPERAVWWGTIPARAGKP